MTKTKETQLASMQKELLKELGVLNIHTLPRVEKVIVNTGMGRMSQQASFQDKLLPEILKELSVITGQKPSQRPAKKSIAGFKLREGQTIGAQVTLRGKRMYDFIYKVAHMVMPRLRDFRGISLKNVDQGGNLNIGFRDQVVFPEIHQDTSMVDFGLQVTIVVNAKNREHAIALYRKLGIPFKKEEDKK